MIEPEIAFADLSDIAAFRGGFRSNCTALTPPASRGSEVDPENETAG
jgi:hypothetical protein